MRPKESRIVTIIEKLFTTGLHVGSELRAMMILSCVIMMSIIVSYNQRIHIIRQHIIHQFKHKKH